MPVTLTNDLEVLRQWIGRTETMTGTIVPFPAHALAATLGRTAPVEGDELPPLWHWLYFLNAAPRDQIGADGHPRRGGFLPPVALPRRMFAGARFEFHAPVTIGARATRNSEVRDVTLKSGRSGAMVLVTVRHEILATGAVALVEENDIVYREPATSSAAPAVAPESPVAESRQSWHADEVMLFRYSALTFNGHRIHYDRRYVTMEEGYPGLVVHGPLTATLLAGRACELAPGRRLSRFQFRAMRPLFDNRRFDLCAHAGADGALNLWAEDDAGAIAMQATAMLHD